MPRRLRRLLPFPAFILLLSSLPLPAQQIENCRFRPEQEAERRIICLTRAQGAAKTDARLDEPWWPRAVVCERFTIGGGKPAQNQTALMAAFDDQNLYLAVVCRVAEIAKLKRTIAEAGRDKGVWGEDCVDFKISPDGGRTEFQFLVNANGARDDTRNSVADWNPSWERAAQVAADSYIVEMAIPLAEIGVPAGRPGASLLFTFGRNDRTTGEVSTAFEPYGDISKSPLLVLGTEKEFREASASVLTREVAVALYLDRDQYPSFEKSATGRVRIASPKTGGRLVGRPSVELSVWQGDRKLAAKTLQPLESPKLDFDLNLGGLVPGAYEFRAEIKDQNDTLGGARREFVIVEGAAARSGRIEITVPKTVAAMSAWPITFGVPFPWGALDSPDNVRLLDANGAEVPIQAKTAGRWSKKGSVRWLLVDFIAPVGETDGRYTLVYGPDVGRAAPQGAAVPLAVETSAEFVVTTGPLRFTVPKNKTPGLAALWLDVNRDGRFDPAEQLIKPDDKSLGAYMISDAGTAFLGRLDAGVSVVLEESGPLKACVRVSGWHVSESGQKLGQYILRYYAYRGLPFIRLYHTFIITAKADEARYRDIGYSLPFPSYFFFFGTPRVDFGRPQKTGAYLLQLDDQRFKIYEEGVFKDEGGRAEGWVTTGFPGRMLTLAVKDFWQQFPKELEVTPAALNVHFWPAHGEAHRRTGANLSVRNIYHQWFAHEGEALDFSIPAEIIPYVDKESPEEGAGGIRAANPMGLAKSHEMLMYFHTEDVERARSRTVNQVFQDAPAAVCAPAWVSGSQVFGRIAPRDPQRFPQVEKALDETFDCIKRQQEMDRDYGMFNYGDSHHNWNWRERRWDLHRIWRNTHHGWTRWPWLLFARTGSKELLAWADANARHIADVDHCHYTTKEFDGLPYPKGKCVGGICDYKGFVHWASGGRLCYNSAADAMLWHYYMTGNERSLTAALEHGAALVADGRPHAHREGSGRATSAAACYFHTWDNDYLEFLERTVDKLLGTQREDGSFPQWENFAPFLQHYVDLTQSRRGMKAMARWADWTAAQGMFEDGYHAKINVLAHAYLYTGDEKYLSAASERVSAFVDHLYEGEDPRYRGMFIAYPSNLEQSYFMLEVPYYLHALAKLGRAPAPPAPACSVTRILSREDLDGKRRYVFRARIRQAADAPMRLKIELRAPPKVAYVARLQPVGGGAPTQSPIGDGSPWRTGEIEVPQDGALDYELIVFGEQGFFVKVPVTHGRPDLKEVYPVLPEGSWIGEGFRYYFAVPDGAASMTLRYQGRAWPIRLEVFDPAGKRAGEDTWIGWSTPYTDTRAFCVTPGDLPRSGWSFRFLAHGLGNLFEPELDPPRKDHVFYFAASPEKWFVPK